MQILVKIVEQMQLRTFPSQTRICVEKDIASEFFILMKGKVRIHQRMGESEFSLDREIGVLEPFSCMGEACLIGGGTADQESADQGHQGGEQTYRTASCTAMTICEMLVLSKDDYMKSLSKAGHDLLKDAASERMNNVYHKRDLERRKTMMKNNMSTEKSEDQIPPPPPPLLRSSSEHTVVVEEDEEEEEEHGGEWHVTSAH